MYSVVECDFYKSVSQIQDVGGGIKMLAVEYMFFIVHDAQVTTWHTHTIKVTQLKF
jgi:hypothetical protein